MCGIAGFFSAKRDYRSQVEKYTNILHAMKEKIAGRGPDENGIFLASKCGLAHTRLSIIDLKDGIQPMVKKKNGYHYVIVYNGEIYNTKELRKDLLLRGESFETTSDTEVVLTAFLHYGTDFVKKLNGIFSFAIFDEYHEKIILYRDSFGVKPLFYTKIDDELIFASEPKALFVFPGCRPAIDKKSLQEVFGMGPARIPGSGIFRGVKEVKPGCYVSISRFGIHEICYWRLESHPHEDSYEDTLKKTGEYVEDAIQRQMVSDVPICTFLSGGVDSSLVSSICSRCLQEKGERLTTFSFDFDGNEKYFQANEFQPSQDRPYVEDMVSYLHSKHHYLSCDYETQAEYLKESILAHDLPCMADIDSSLSYFCHEVSKTHKVVLTGECADEVFGGYPWFHKEKFFSKNMFPWTLDLAPRMELLREDVKQELQIPQFVQQAYEMAVSEIEVLPRENEVESKRRQIGYLNIRFFMQTLLNRMDRTSMRWGLEARVPFADRRLVEYVFNIPWEMKAKNGVVKNILRSSSIGKLPDEILFRKKSPYPKSYHPFYEELLGKKLLEVMEDSHAPVLQLIDKKKTCAFIQSVKDYGKPWYGQLMAGPQMLAYLWQVNEWMKQYGLTI